MILIFIPENIIELCSNWYANQSCTLYAVSSTGGLTLGNRRPLGCDTDEKWHLQIWREFSCDIGLAYRSARKIDHEDAEKLGEAECWVDTVCAFLEESYGLSDWDY